LPKVRRATGDCPTGRPTIEVRGSALCAFALLTTMPVRLDVDL
jgi:hypothetical protein